MKKALVNTFGNIETVEVKPVTCGHIENDLLKGFYAVAGKEGQFDSLS